jgi:hypothetical protein
MGYAVNDDKKDDIDQSMVKRLGAQGVVQR